MAGWLLPTVSTAGTPLPGRPLPPPSATATAAGLRPLPQQRECFDYILIESTGLCNPGPVAAALWTDAELESGVCLDAIVTVADAKLIRRQLSEPRPEGAVNEAQQQVAFADVVLLNKVGTA